jgi:hypothetical protein
MYLVDGRTFRISHPEMVTLERYAVVVTVFEESGHIEVIDVALIVSFRTLMPI